MFGEWITEKPIKMEILGNGIVRDKGTFLCIKEQFLPLIFAHNVRIDFSEAESQDRCDNRRKHLVFNKLLYSSQHTCQEGGSKCHWCFAVTRPPHGVFNKLLSVIGWVSDSLGNKYQEMSWTVNMLFHWDPLKVWHRDLSDGQQIQRVNSSLP